MLSQACLSFCSRGGGGCVSQHALGQTPPHPTATAADGTHPTGMHSCLKPFCTKDFTLSLSNLVVVIQPTMVTTMTEAWQSVRPIPEGLIDHLVGNLSRNVECMNWSA